MQKTIQEERLSDGSTVYNLVVADPGQTFQTSSKPLGTPYIKTQVCQVCFHCVDSRAAAELSDALGRFTVDFIEQGGMNARYLEQDLPSYGAPMPEDGPAFIED